MGRLQLQYTYSKKNKRTLCVSYYPQPYTTSRRCLPSPTTLELKGSHKARLIRPNVRSCWALHSKLQQEQSHKIIEKHSFWEPMHWRRAYYIIATGSSRLHESEIAKPVNRSCRSRDRHTPHSRPNALNRQYHALATDCGLSECKLHRSLQKIFIPKQK